MLIDKDNYKKIFEQHYQSLVMFANRFLSAVGESEDLVQEVFVDLWENKNEFPNDIALKVFLYKAVRNKCYNIIKHNKVKEKYTQEVKNSIQDDGFFLKQIIEEEIVVQLYKAIETLPERKVEIIKLSLKGYSNQAIADELEVKLQTIKTMKSQAYKILKERFQNLEKLILFLLS